MQIDARLIDLKGGEAVIHGVINGTVEVLPPPAVKTPAGVFASVEPSRAAPQERGYKGIAACLPDRGSGFAHENAPA